MRKDHVEGAREIGGLQEGVLSLGIDHAGVNRQELGLPGDLSARDANVRRLAAEAAETKIRAALVAERALRAAAEAEVTRLIEVCREFDNPAVRSFARVVRRGARLLRQMKEFASIEGLLPGRRRQRRRKQRLVREAEIIVDSGLFDHEWYLRTFPDVALSGKEPLNHYLQCGVVEGRNPNPLFDTQWYLRRYPDVAAMGQNPLVHYVQRGATEKRDPGPEFSTEWYLDGNPDVAAAGVDPLKHFLHYGQAEGRLLHRPSPARAYRLWQTRFDYQPEQDRPTCIAALAALPWHPRISILMPVYNPNPTDLEDAIQSVENQIFPEWELCIADDASTNASIKTILEAALLRDRRIKVVYRERNGHISEATNSAFALATGDYIGLLDHDDVLREHALAEIVIALNNRPDAELLYSDEDKLGESGERYDAHFKPDFSHDLFYSMNYLNHFTVHRAENIRKVGGWRKGYEGGQDYDINLRIIETIDPRRIVHIPKILYHWRAVKGSTAQAESEKNYAYAAGFRALEDHVARCGLPAKVEEIEGLPVYRLRWNVPHPEPLVSLIIPTRDMVDVLRTCVSSIIEKTAYTNYEILIIDNDSCEKATLEYLAEVVADPRIRVLSYARPFNYSAINNFAAHEAKGIILGLINNDIEVSAPEWLDEMVAHALRPEIGCVGAKLLYPDDMIQHAGVILGLGGVAGHGHSRFSRTEPGYFRRLQVVQNYSAVTAACLLVRAEIFWQVGGLDERDLTVAFNDVDFCLKVREAGYRNLFTPFALLYHHESLSRGYEDTPEKMLRFAGEVAVMKERWWAELLTDPFYSPNLTLDHADFSFRLH
ncbi:MAG: glycosyltransferase family 2 protein [Pseudomonadota bacterium]